jgi:hypothetical protein
MVEHDQKRRRHIVLRKCSVILLDLFSGSVSTDLFGGFHVYWCWEESPLKAEGQTLVCGDSTKGSSRETWLEETRRSLFTNTAPAFVDIVH